MRVPSRLRRPRSSSILETMSERMLSVIHCLLSLLAMIFASSVLHLISLLGRLVDATYNCSDSSEHCRGVIVTLDVGRLLCRGLWGCSFLYLRCFWWPVLHYVGNQHYFDH